MFSLIAGIAVVTLTALLFWRTLPREGKTHWIAGSRWEPYYAILFILGVSLGVGLMISAA
jgi:hypothetical protein